LVYDENHSNFSDVFCPQLVLYRSPSTIFDPRRHETMAVLNGARISCSQDTHWVASTSNKGQILALEHNKIHPTLGWTSSLDSNVLHYLHFSLSSRWLKN